MQPTPPIYPEFKLRHTPSVTQHLLGNSPTPCKPVAIISHNTEVSLITCSKLSSTGGSQASCHHREYESRSTLPLANLIKDLQQKGCSVYSQNSADGTLTDHFPELSHSDLAEMDTSDTSFIASPQDLEAHPVDENRLLQLLPPEANNPLVFTQQAAASTNALQQPAPANLQASTSSALSVNQSPSTSAAASTSAVPSTSGTPSANTAPSKSQAPYSRSLYNITVATLPQLKKRAIYCMLSVLNDASGPLSRLQCINAMNTRYTDFRHLTSDTVYSHCFILAIRFGLIEKRGRQNSYGGITYRILPAGVDFINNH